MKLSSFLVVGLFGIAIISEIALCEITGTVIIKSKLTGKYVCAELNNDGILIANRIEAHEWERFSANIYFDENTNEKIVYFRADINNKYVCAESQGNEPLVANRDWVLQWEQFVLTINTPPEEVTFSFQSRVNGKYVRVRSVEDPVLEATSDTIGDAETFYMDFLQSN